MTPLVNSFAVEEEEIRLTCEGVLQINGEEITHERTKNLFFQNLVEKSDGYYLEIGREVKKIIVEDTLYFIRSLTGSAREGYSVMLSDGSQEKLKPGTLEFSPGRLVCRVKATPEKPKGSAARFCRAPYHELLAATESDELGFYLRLGDARVSL